MIADLVFKGPNSEGLATVICCYDIVHNALHWKWSGRFRKDKRKKEQRRYPLQPFRFLMYFRSLGLGGICFLFYYSMFVVVV
jgi:hypothetical protein